MSGYDIFSAYYDRLTNNVGYNERAEYFCELLAENGVTDGLLLDLACGTGSLSIELIKRGFDVIGVDASEGMLTQARQKFYEAEQPAPLLLCQRLEGLDLYGTVDAAVCALDSLNHLTDSKQVRHFFKRLAYFINPGGVFVFDVNTVYKHRHILADNVFVYDLDDLYCVWQNHLCEDGMTVDIDLDFFVSDGKSYHRSGESFSECAYELDDIKKWLDKSGFDVRNVFAELSHETVTQNTQRAVITAVKR